MTVQEIAKPKAFYLLNTLRSNNELFKALKQKNGLIMPCYQNWWLQHQFYVSMSSWVKSIYIKRIVENTHRAANEEKESIKNVRAQTNKTTSSLSSFNAITILHHRSRRKIFVKDEGMFTRRWKKIFFFSFSFLLPVCGFKHNGSCCFSYSKCA